MRIPPTSPSFMILFHDQNYRLSLRPQCLKTSSCFKENHFYSKYTNRRFGSHAAWEEAADGDGLLSSRGAWTLWPEKQTPRVPLCSILRRVFPLKDDFILQVQNHLVVLMSSLSEDYATNGCFLLQGKPAFLLILATPLMLTPTQFHFPSRSVRAKPHTPTLYQVLNS